MARGYFVNAGKTSYFWQLIDRLPGVKIYDKDVDVVPYSPLEHQTYINFSPSLAIGTELRAYINDVFVTKTKIINALGQYYVPVITPYGPFSIKIYSDDLLTTYAVDNFNAVNYALFFSVLAPLLQELDIEVQCMLGDLYSTDVRDDKIYDRFGAFFDFFQPNFFTTDEYRETLVGSTSTNKPGFKQSYLYGSTVKGVKETIQSITGVVPDFVSFREVMGWTLYSKLPPPPLPGVPWPLHIYAFGATDPTHSLCILYSARFKQFTLLVRVYNSIRTVVNEQDFKQGSDIIPTSNVDNFQNKNLTTDLVVITQGINVYVETIDFIVDRVNGKILWIFGQPQPTQNTFYSASYKFYMKDLIEEKTNKAKPAQIKLLYEYVS